LLQAIEVDALRSEADEAGCLRFNVLQDTTDEKLNENIEERFSGWMVQHLKDKYKYEIVDGNFLNDPLVELPEILLENKASVLGMTVMPGPQLNEAVPLVKKIKKILPDLPIVWGGYFPTQHSEVVLESGYVDYVVYSQGERTFLELLDVLETGGSLSDVKGISYLVDGHDSTC